MAPDRSPLRVGMTVEQCWQPQPGGSGTYVRELLTELSGRADLRLTGLTARHGGRTPEGDRLPVPLRRSPVPRRALYQLWQSTRRPRPDRGLDVVHATTWAIPGRRRPLVVTVHDLAFLQDPEHFTAHGAAFFRRGLEITRREATAVVVPSHATRAECVEQGIDPARITVVPHGVRPVHTTPEDVARFRARHGLTRPYVLWTGTREPRKNLPVLVQAFEQFATGTGLDVDLVLVGPEGWGPETARLRRVPTDRVRVLGRLPRTELDAAYAGALLFCYPSLREGYGLPVTEAMAHGVPVVTSSGTATEEAAGGAAVLVEPRDPADVARGLAEAADPTRREVLRTGSLARAADLDWSRTADQTAAVLSRAAADGPR
ncbi:glycosyltransferase family 4 protein [Modestobacter sp. VKM Ac-2985]|uniref:glycosyltransferase family 4 protein n=1 Tax=Modestobacter sp. VKM Ac-2985 TaxID=3004139 RepID=UPI0022AB7FB5|nr:glycosyltransferase family 1 protein [Modestobacter sp. VKM Ac-2985]MCZ2838601.1 glycosyltransferase family 1 protein [Modestobacter sp. VKM Ac-2985]